LQHPADSFPRYKLETISFNFFLNRTVPKMVINVKAAILKNVVFLDMTQCSLVEHISTIAFQGNVVSLRVMKT